MGKKLYLPRDLIIALDPRVKTIRADVDQFQWQQRKCRMPNSDETADCQNQDDRDQPRLILVTDATCRWYTETGCVVTLQRKERDRREF